MSDWSWRALLEVLPDLLRGATFTVAFTLVAFPLALAVGLLLALGEASRRWALRLSAHWFVEFVRSTPLLVQIYLLYFSLPQTGIILPAPVVGIVALALHYACYISRVYLAGLQSVPAGQREACVSLGLPRWITMRKIILPQALLPIYPALANYFITLFKETPLLSAIGIVELMQAAKIAGAETFRYTEPFTAAALIFLLLSLVAAGLLRILERRLGAYHRR
jgi:polar amino acid transport system permease protein